MGAVCGVVRRDEAEIGVVRLLVWPCAKKRIAAVRFSTRDVVEPATDQPRAKETPVDGVVLARAHGAANLVFGLWPLVHLRSFEGVFGPKVDRWLVRTVSGLLVVNGLTQLSTSSAPSSVRQARRLGVGTAAVLAAIDLVYVPAGRISKMYLVDAAVELGWILAWHRVELPGS